MLQWKDYPMPETRKTIAFIGLGAMGMPMARRLVEHQFRVQGFDLLLAI